MVLLGGSSSSVSVEAETMQVESPTETELPTSTGKNYSMQVSETIFSRKN